jgi:hypothetical protein
MEAGMAETTYDVCFGSPKGGVPAVLLTMVDEHEADDIAARINAAELYQAEGLRAFVRPRVVGPAPVPVLEEVEVVVALEESEPTGEDADG